MVKVSIIYSNEIEGDRLDAQFYSPEFLDNLRILKRYPKIIKITEITKVITHLPGFLRDKYLVYVKEGIPYLRQVNISLFDGVNLKKDVVYIPKHVHEIFKVSQVKKGDILLTVTGVYYGIAVPIIENLGELNACPDIVKITPDEKKINPVYLAIFLNSKYGYIQLRRWSSGVSRPRILTQHIRKIVVPILPKEFQEYIEELVKQAYEKRRLAEQKYQKAEDLLYKLLGTSKYEIEKLGIEKAYEINSKEIKQTFRFDAGYYHPKYSKVIELLKKAPFELKPLKEVVRISNETIDPAKEPYRSKKFKYVPIAKISESGEIFEWEEFYGWQAPSRARMVIRKGDILVPSLKGTFDKIALVPEELDRQLATTGCFVVRAKKDYPEFLFLLFRSSFFKRQLEQQTTGAIMSAVPKSVFGNLLIPDIPKNKQEKIAGLIKEYFKLRKESRQLVQKAIKEVEKAIEDAARLNR